MGKLKIKKITRIASLPTKTINVLTKKGQAFTRKQHYRPKDPTLPKSVKIRTSETDKIVNSRERLSLSSSPYKKKRDRALELLDRQHKIFEKQNPGELVRDIIQKQDPITVLYKDAQIENMLVPSKNPTEQAAISERIIDNILFRHGSSSHNKKIVESILAKNDPIEIDKYIQSGLSKMTNALLSRAKTKGYRLKDELTLMPIKHDGDNIAAILAKKIKAQLKDKNVNVGVVNINQINGTSTNKTNALFKTLNQPRLKTDTADIGKDSNIIILDGLSNNGVRLTNAQKLIKSKNLKLVDSTTLLSLNAASASDKEKTKKLRGELALFNDSDILNSVLMKNHKLSLSSMNHVELSSIDAFIKKVASAAKTNKENAVVLAAEMLSKYKNNEFVDASEKTHKINTEHANSVDTLIKNGLKKIDKKDLVITIKSMKRRLRHAYMQHFPKIKIKSTSDQQQDDKNDNGYLNADE